MLFHTPGDLPTPGIEPMSPASPALAGGFFNTVATNVSIFGAVIFIKYSKNTVIMWEAEFYFLTFCFNEHVQKHTRIFQIYKTENRG